MNLEQKSLNFWLNKPFVSTNKKNLPSGDFFILFNTNTLKIILKLSAELVWKLENSFYICTRLAQISKRLSESWGDTQAANEGRL
jgi:hypothetical protein